MTQEARAADTKLRRAVAWFSWRWAALLGFLGAGVILAVVLVTNTLVGWEHFQIDSLLEQRAALTEEVQRLQATAKTWRQKAGRANLRAYTKTKILIVKACLRAIASCCSPKNGLLQINR